MAEEETLDPAAEAGSEAASTLEGGAYDVLKNRLNKLDKDLRDRLDKFNEKRKTVFGGQELEIIGNERIQTENNCIARDVVSIGDKLVFGYNVFMGMKQETAISDVFDVFRFDGRNFHPEEKSFPVM